MIDRQDGAEGDETPVCVGGRGAAPPQYSGGPTGYRLMLKRQNREATLCDAGLREAGIQLLAEACPKEPAQTWELLRSVLEEGLQSIDQRLEESGPLEPECFSLVKTNERLAELQRRRFWA